ncbi:MAG: hypothetical protein IPL61_22965 [Myxococcales bacterium]|nr:hypothetical protein [Myxococcales bacterium]
MRLAEEKGLDLVEISPRAFPAGVPDHGPAGGYKYEQARKEAEAKARLDGRDQEIKFRPKTEGTTWTSG